ncbi:MAG: Ig-like domain-containing protein [Planctomycetota bacterium]|nr:Ig-like domain-containing protein [Planctomycetota bacterium]
MSHAIFVRILRTPLAVLLAAMLSLTAASCGGAGGGPGPFGAGQGLVLLNFSLDSVDNVALNTVVEMEFSEPVDGDTINAAAVQIREGPAFGQDVPGEFRIVGSTVLWEPRLPSLCDNSDSALKPDTTYRVQLIGFPEEFSIRNTQGQPLDTTQTYEFQTRADTDPDKFIDQLPGTPPVVTGASPANGSEAVKVEGGNKVVLTVSENIDPCTVNDMTVFFHIYQFGDIATSVAANGGTGNPSGFARDSDQATSDQTPLDPFTWMLPAQQALVQTLATPQKIPARIQLEQSFASTQIEITPLFGFSEDPLANQSKFPENALVVVQVTFGVEDFGGNSLTPFTMSFTTENLPPQNSEYIVENEGETAYIDAVTTAEIHEPRAPSRVQGFLLFAGDSDNGSVISQPTLPEDDAACTTPRQVNDGIPDDFDPAADFVFDTGATRNLCPNTTDGSLAVVWEFRTFRIRNGVTVRVIGNNPAIFLVQGDVTIESGGTLLLRSDGSGGAQSGRGATGHNDTTSGNPPDARGGTGIAGGGDGGEGTAAPINSGLRKGADGFQGYGTGATDDHGSTTAGGLGAGEGGSAVDVVNGSNPWPQGASGAGGGGGHAVEGGDGPQAIGAATTRLTNGVGNGGLVVPNRANADELLTPSAGSGGGGAGYSVEIPGTFKTGGGGGGAGGGFVDLTSSGDILVAGTIDAAGSRGGNGGSESFHGGGGGGGGSGGGIRLLTPNDINVSGGTITTVGGSGGTGNRGTAAPQAGPQNDGGDGGHGRIAMEDGNSVITGIGGASVTPGEGTPGFHRANFNPGRFQGGGLVPQATSEIFAIGPLNPDYQVPAATDFRVGVPVVASRGAGNTAMLIEAQGFQALPDGNPDLGSGTGWWTVCRFVDSGIETSPTQLFSNPPGTVADPATAPTDNAGVGIDNLDGSEFFQLRITIWLPDSVGPFDAGPFVDQWVIKFSHDQ